MAATMSVASTAASGLGSVATRRNATGVRNLKALPLRVTRPARAAVVRAEKLQQETDQYEVIPEPDRRDTRQIEAGNISNENAEKRANIGNSRAPTVAEAQAFDGPAPETINGRLSMLGVTAALAAEKFSGLGIKEQVGLAPVPILASFILISFASYIPIVRGYTRKEEFANGIWTPKAENWNGRLAMVGFTALLITEALSGVNTFQFWQNIIG